MPAFESHDDIIHYSFLRRGRLQQVSNGMERRRRRATVGLLYVPEDRAGVIPSAQPDEPIWKDVVAFEVGSQDKDGVEPRIVGTVEFLAISTYTDYSGPNDGKPGWWPGDLVQVEMFDVLWVGREGDIAYRRGLGYIRRDVWERWAPETITTILG